MTPVESALPSLRRTARVIRSWGPIDPLDVNELVQIGALAFLVAYPKARTNPDAYAKKAAEWEMKAAVIDRFGQRGVLHPDAILEYEGRFDEGKCLPRVVKRAIRSLKRPYRSVLWAVYVDRKSITEIAVELGAKAATVSTWRHRAVFLLRRKFDPTVEWPYKATPYKPNGRKRGGVRVKGASS